MSAFENDLTLVHADVCDCNHAELPEKNCREVRGIVRSAHSLAVRTAEKSMRERIWKNVSGTGASMAERVRLRNVLERITLTPLTGESHE